MDFSVEALSHVRYGRIGRAEIRERFPGPAFLDLVSRLLIAERRDADDVSLRQQRCGADENSDADDVGDAWLRREKMRIKEGQGRLLRFSFNPSGYVLAGHIHR